jgi:hypothetical protein
MTAESGNIDRYLNDEGGEISGELGFGVRHEATRKNF